MTKYAATTAKKVRDSRTGQFLEVRGFGALKGRLEIAKGLDLTKPIFEQVTKKQKAAGETKAVTAASKV